MLSHLISYIFIIYVRIEWIKLIPVVSNDNFQATRAPAGAAATALATLGRPLIPTRAPQTSPNMGVAVLIFPNTGVVPPPSRHTGGAGTQGLGRIEMLVSAVPY